MVRSTRLLILTNNICIYFIGNTSFLDRLLFKESIMCILLLYEAREFYISEFRQRASSPVEVHELTAAFEEISMVPPGSPINQPIDSNPLPVDHISPATSFQECLRATFRFLQSTVYKKELDSALLGLEQQYILRLGKSAKQQQQGGNEIS